MKYSEEEALKKANDFITEVNILEKKYGLTFNSDSGDVYLTYQTTEKDKFWGHIDLGWDGDSSGIKVKHKNREQKIKEEALAKLTDVEREILGL